MWTTNNCVTLDNHQKVLSCLKECLSKKEQWKIIAGRMSGNRLEYEDDKVRFIIPLGDFSSSIKGFFVHEVCFYTFEEKKKFKRRGEDEEKFHNVYNYEFDIKDWARSELGKYLKSFVKEFLADFRIKKCSDMNKRVKDSV